MLFALIDLHNLYSNEDGWFFRSNKDLQDDTDLSQNLVKVVLDTLYQAGIINVFSVGQGKGHTSNRIHINFENFTKYEAYSFNDIRNNPDLRINTLSYKDHHTPSYCERIGESVSEGVSEVSSEGIGEKMTTILDTPYSPNTLNTPYSKEIILDNIDIEEDISTGDKSIQPGNIEIQVENTITPFERYLQSFNTKYPSINYEYPPEEFNSIYKQELLEYQTIIRNDTGVVIPINELSTHLHFYKSTGRVLEW